VIPMQPFACSCAADGEIVSPLCFSSLRDGTILPLIMKRSIAAIIFCLFPVQAYSQNGVAAISVELTPEKDNTIYQESNNSNALGQGIFTGNTASGYARRALVKFNLSSIPVGSRILSASLSLTVTRTLVGASDLTLHRLTKDWGATTSQASQQEGIGGTPGPGDATWNAPAYQQGANWSVAGGDFLATTILPASASTGPVLVQGLAFDVQQFVNHPAFNFGWLLKGDETSERSAKRYGSRENAGVGPKLTVNYTLPQTRRQIWEQLYFPNGQLVDGAADTDHDGISNLLEYAWASNPLQPSSMVEAFEVIGSADEMIVRFLRDPRTTDINLSLEVSDDLISWKSVTVSLAGGVPVGVAFLTESVVPGREPLRRVTASISKGGQRKYTRLTAIRPALP
jgi:hypothetical protein